jgi:hypothetical protein
LFSFSSDDDGEINETPPKKIFKPTEKVNDSDNENNGDKDSDVSSIPYPSDVTDDEKEQESKEMSKETREESFISFGKDDNETSKNMEVEVSGDVMTLSSPDVVYEEEVDSRKLRVLKELLFLKKNHSTNVRSSYLRSSSSSIKASRNPPSSPSLPLPLIPVAKVVPPSQQVSVEEKTSRVLNYYNTNHSILKHHHLDIAISKDDSFFRDLFIIFRLMIKSQ